MAYAYLFKYIIIGDTGRPVVSTAAISGLLAMLALLAEPSISAVLVCPMTW